MSLRSLLSKFVVGLCLVSPSIAQDLFEEEVEVDVYKVYIRNLQIGELEFSHQFRDGKYEADVNFKTKSLAGALFNLTFEGHVEGTGVKDGQYYSGSANYTLDSDGAVQTYNLIYDDEVLTERVYSPRLYPEIDPESQKGAIDPLTAAVLILRETPFDKVCSKQVYTFDGLTANFVVLGAPVQRADGRFQCNGGIDRMDGYNEEADGFVKSEYFTALYRLNRKTGNFILDRLIGQSPYGQYRIVRQ